MSQSDVTLICSGVTVLIPLAIGIRVRAGSAFIALLGLFALALSVAGWQLLMYSRMYALSYLHQGIGNTGISIDAYLSGYGGLLLGGIACAAGLRHAHHTSRRIWFWVLLLGSLLPLVVTVGIFDYASLIIEAQPQTSSAPFAGPFFTAEQLWFAIGAVAPLATSIYGLWAYVRKKQVARRRAAAADS